MHSDLGEAHGGDSVSYSFQEAKERCVHLGQIACGAITCSDQGTMAVCTVRASSMLESSHCAGPGDTVAQCNHYEATHRYEPHSYQSNNAIEHGEVSYTPSDGCFDVLGECDALVDHAQSECESYGSTSIMRGIHGAVSWEWGDGPRYTVSPIEGSYCEALTVLDRTACKSKRCWEGGRRAAKCSVRRAHKSDVKDYYINATWFTMHMHHGTIERDGTLNREGSRTNCWDGDGYPLDFCTELRSQLDSMPPSCRDVSNPARCRVAGFNDKHKVFFKHSIVSTRINAMAFSK